MTQVAICVILGVASVATFMLNGRQWPTFLVTLIFGTYFGHTTAGQWCMARVGEFFAMVNDALS
jgi:hypothetical protein